MKWADAGVLLLKTCAASGCLGVARILNTGTALYPVSGEHKGGLPSVTDA